VNAEPPCIFFIDPLSVNVCILHMTVTLFVAVVAPSGKIIKNGILHFVFKLRLQKSCYKFKIYAEERLTFLKGA